MQSKISIKRAQEHNLKDLSLEIPRDKIVVFTGKSGSGKSSLAFDTIYAEGYRKYMESLSADARKLLSQMDKPKVESITGLSPVISIEQIKSLGANPRTTLATITEIADYARLIWSLKSQQYCPDDGGLIVQYTIDDCVDKVLSLDKDSAIYILAPKIKAKLSIIKQEIENLKQRAWQRIRLNNKIFNLDEDIKVILKGLSAKSEINLELVVDRFPLSSVSQGRIADSLELAFSEGEEKAIVFDGKQDILLSVAFACQKCAKIYQKLTPQHFSPNHPLGACQNCSGLGLVTKTSEKLAIPDDTKSVKKGAIKAMRLGSKNIIIRNNRILKELALQIPFDPNIAWKNLDEDTKKIILFGDKDRLFTFRTAGRKHITKPFEGVLELVDKLYKQTGSDSVRTRLSVFQTSQTCPVCDGTRLSKRSQNVFVEDKSFGEFSKMSVDESLAFMNTLKASSTYEDIFDIVDGLQQRLSFLSKVGLGYLGLDRQASTLAGGEAQRARLATQLGMKLTGVTYVLDEPTIGLHPNDDKMLLEVLDELKERGNSVLVVEHDESAIKKADWIVELGPQAGQNGGHLIFNGSLADCLKSETSQTAKYLNGDLSIKKNAKELKPNKKYISIKNARQNNLKGIDVKIPVGLLSVVCGVSGSGKSTLISDILAKQSAYKLNNAKDIAGLHSGILGLEQFKTCVRVDQTPIGKSPRSIPATYTKIFDYLRQLYATCPLAKLRNYKASHFSFNLKGGRCQHCKGDGYISLDMQFMGEVYITCPSCNAKRYNRQTLEVKYKNKDISEVLDMTVSEAIDFFENHPKIITKLKTLKDVGLEYLKLGQATNTLSGGEAQRIKLSLELSKRSNSNTLYILDEPTTGLHFDDIQKLFNLLFELRDSGNTIVIIEHHPDVISMADWVIELGPKGGKDGGHLIFEGSPKKLAKSKTPTSKFIKI